MRRRLWIALLLLIIIGVPLGGWLYLRTSLPQISGSVSIDGIEGPVEIVRDQDGVPHIYATTDHDAFFALGYVHAQDRMWQMEMNRRVGNGRLSEILGETTLSTDKFLRTLGPARAARSAWEHLAPEYQAMLQAYADGVNAWIDGDHTLPPEFLILGVEPEPWTVYDSLVWAKMMAWDLGGNYDTELLRARLIQALGEERTEELLAPYPEDGIDIIPSDLPPLNAESIDALLDLDTKLQVDFSLGGLNVGSNNWVIDGSRTESGLPLLSNDPHLGSGIPSVWYLAEIQGDRIHAIGATFPGLPGIVIGHNEQIAWGVTNMGPDVQDLYVERINPNNPNQYEVNGEWVDMEIVEEVIEVQGEEEPIRWAARSTRHGPLISDVSSAATMMSVAMRWTALNEADTTLEAFMALNYATDWESFRDALRAYQVPVQNFVYADRDGNIGYIGPGLIPIRARGKGMVPVPGWTDEYEWTGYIPFDELPQAFNPEAGYIVTANNRVVDEDYPYFISSDWAAPYRAARIAQLIEEMSSGDARIDVGDVALMLADQKSLQTETLLPILLAVTPEDERQAEAVAYLEAWDGVFGRESVAATIYEAWMLHLGRALFEDNLHGDLYDRMADRRNSLFLAIVMTDPEEHRSWCENVLLAPQESCEDTARTALDNALDELEERLGTDMSSWAWGKIHRTQYPHNPFSEVPILRRFFHRAIPNGGNAYTINVAPVRIADRYDQYHVPSYRHIVDLADFNNSLYIHTTGQSGNVLSAHYDDLIERHRDVEFLPMFFGRAAVEGDVLTLRPE